MHVKSTVAGIVKEIRIKHKDGSETVLDEFKNLIVNKGLDSLGTINAELATRGCIVSSNSNLPLATDSSVLNQVGSLAGTTNQTLTNSGGVPTWFFEMERVYDFGLGGVVGNISKLYITNNTGTEVFSSALIKDGLGNPTTISVTADDQLFVTWALRKNIDTTPITGVISIAVNGVPTDFNYEILPANLANSSAGMYFSAVNSIGQLGSGSSAYETNVLGAVTGRPAGTASSISSYVLAGYSSGNFYRDVTYTASTSQFNFTTGLGSLTYANPGSGGTGNVGYQISFNPKLPKDSDRNLSLPFRISWGRA